MVPNPRDCSIRQIQINLQAFPLAPPKLNNRQLTTDNKSLNNSIFKKKTATCEVSDKSYTMNDPWLVEIWVAGTCIIVRRSIITRIDEKNTY